jgi:V/A-type H+-transporting ATPase subunit A
MIRGKEITEQINILGDDGVPLDYHQTFWKSELIDFVILQQDSFDEIDASTPMLRQLFMLNLILSICDIHFVFGHFNEVSAYFRKLINICRQMNFSRFESDEFKRYKEELDREIEKHPKNDEMMRL